MKDLYIKKHIWNKNDNNIFFNSLNSKVNIENINRYIPILALYLYYHNTKKAHKLLDVDRKYYINEILNVEELKYYNSNMLSEIKLYNKIDNKINQTECFIKVMPILDIISYINHFPPISFN